MLEGLKVVELANYIAGPATGAVLADWGADVIKVESPAGDPHRRFFAHLTDGSEGNPVFDMDNRGKRSAVLDITTEAGREAMLRLFEQADVFVTNVRPAALKRAGLDYEAVAARCPRLIYASITGYGLEGPEADKPGFDVAAFWARSAMASLTAPKGMEPFPLRTGVGDHTCALATVSAILAAVIERGRTGHGRLVENSLIRTGVYAMSTDLAIQLKMGRIASTRPREQAISPLANFFRTSDGRWLCVVPRENGADWPNIARAARVEAHVDDERFASGRARRANAAALVGLMDEAFAQMTQAEAGARLDAEDVVWAPIATPAELSQDPQAEAAGCFVAMPDGHGGTYRAPASPARFPGADDGPKGPAPGHGQHTREILAEIGFGGAEIEAMFKEGAAA